MLILDALAVHFKTNVLQVITCNCELKDDPQY